MNTRCRHGTRFTLSEEQLELRAGARQFADSVLTQVAGAIGDIPGPEERFYALKPFFQQMVDAGFLKALNAGYMLADLKIRIERRAS